MAVDIEKHLKVRCRTIKLCYRNFPVYKEKFLILHFPKEIFNRISEKIIELISNMCDTSRNRFVPWGGDVVFFCLTRLRPVSSILPPTIRHRKNKRNKRLYT